MSDAQTSQHRRAAEAFARQARAKYGDVLETILLYGSVVRDEQRGVASDVDLCVVLTEDANRDEYEPAIRELAYDLELEHGVVLSLVITDTTAYQSTDPFFDRVVQNAERLYGGDDHRRQS